MDLVPKSLHRWEDSFYCLPKSRLILKSAMLEYGLY